jgi:hypothetical protein
MVVAGADTTLKNYVGQTPMHVPCDLETRNALKEAYMHSRRSDSQQQKTYWQRQSEAVAKDAAERLYRRNGSTERLFYPDVGK